MTAGKNFAEVIHVLEVLKRSTSKGVATAEGCQVDQDANIPDAVNNADAETNFGKFEKRLSYLREVKLG